MSQKPLSKSQKAILAAGRALFWQFGIKKVTVEEIADAAGISKMTFYRNFENKNAVAVAVFKAWVQDGRQKYREIMAKDLPFPDKIGELIQFKHQNSLEMSETLLKDLLQQDNPMLQNVFFEYKATFTEEVKNDLKKAQKEGWIRKDLSIEMVLFLMEDLQQKIHQGHLNQYYARTSDLILELTQFFFYGISPIPNGQKDA